MTHLVWFRNDLRIRHAGLRDALASGEPVCALYLLCQQQWDSHGVAPARRWYVLESLRELGRELARRGVPLFILEAGDFDHCPAVLADFVRTNEITDIHCTREYPLNERRRDRAVAEHLTALGVRLHGRDESMLVPPDRLRTGRGTPYTVFTPYARRWRGELERSRPAPVAPPPVAAQTVSFDEALINQAVDQLRVPDAIRAAWPAGEAAALERLERFLDTGLCDYQAQRDFPERAGTSGLSAALSAGTLSPARAWWLAQEALLSGPCRGADTWINELAWRDFYRQIMALYPQLSRGHAFRPEEAFIGWSDNEQHWRAWCEGRTGYPLVDAAMRQLRDTGWMHNRLRMVSAMFLSKHLMIDWRRGERFFMEHLVDGDFAANNGGWQWSASVGTDAVPYFRVFNPVRQGQRFDPEGRFIARYVPELAHLDARVIHEPWKASPSVPAYPAPCVAHQGVRERVGDIFRGARAALEDNKP